MKWLCRIGLHRYGTPWQNIAPTSGGGHLFIRERCLRCFHDRTTRNRR